MRKVWSSSVFYSVFCSVFCRGTPLRGFRLRLRFLCIKRSRHGNIMALIEKVKEIKNGNITEEDAGNEVVSDVVSEKKNSVV